MGYDIYLSRIGDRPTGSRVWVEDSFQRLRRNGFEVGTSLDIKPRAGRGLLVTASKDFTGRAVSQRKGAPLLSLEGPWVSDAIDGDMVRVKLGFRNAVIIPRIYAFHIRKQGLACSLTGTVIDIGADRLSLASERPVRLPTPITSLAFKADWSNLVFGCEFVANHRPEFVNLTGPEVGLAAAFLRDAGYVESEAGCFRHNN